MDMNFDKLKCYLEVTLGDQVKRCCLGNNQTTDTIACSANWVDQEVHEGTSQSYWAVKLMAGELHFQTCKIQVYNNTLTIVYLI